jgi:uncharacterized protein (UPF0548 family)
LTYPEVGATRSELPSGYRRDEYQIALGEGPAVFRRAVLGLRQWRAHRGAGLTVWPGGAPLIPGVDVLVVLALPLVSAVAACRIVYVIDQPDCFGFAYGSLPAHPERGEEAFLVRRDPAGSVSFGIRVFSRPQQPLVRLGGPVARRVQVATTHRYLEALKEFVAHG